MKSFRFDSLLRWIGIPGVETPEMMARRKKRERRQTLSIFAFLIGAGMVGLWNPNQREWPVIGLAILGGIVIYQCGSERPEITSAASQAPTRLGYRLLAAGLCLLCLTGFGFELGMTIQEADFSWRILWGVLPSAAGGLMFFQAAKRGGFAATSNTEHPTPNI